MSGESEFRVSVRSLRKTYHRPGGGTVVPVDDISLDVSDREMLVLLGASGCGKTTLLRCIAGLERPDSGEIAINGKVVFSGERKIFLPPQNRPVAMVFQSYALWPHMTVFENIAYPLQNHRTSKQEIRAAVHDVMEVMGLRTLGARLPSEISGGQQQRVALARAVISRSGVILFDEPLSNVDANVREQLRLELLEMQRDFGFSGVYVTHDQAEAMAIADRIALLKQGTIEQLGRPDEIYSRPRSRYAATFIGNANVWRCRIARANDQGTEVDSPVGRLVAMASDGTIGGAGAGSAVVALVRPEALRLSREAPGGTGSNVVACEVGARSFFGPYVEYVVNVGSEKVRVWAPASDGVLEKGAAWLTIPGERLIVLADPGDDATERDPLPGGGR